MSTFLGIQHTTDGIEIALFNETSLLSTVYDDKKRASKNIIALIGQLLETHNVTIDDLDFIAVNQGPGPFTTLRVVIASVNGLSFATKKPLIGIDGLDALIREHADKNYTTTVALLNAYSNDAYYAIASGASLTTGYRNISALLQELKQSDQQPFYFIGSGTELYRQEIIATLSGSAIIPSELPQQCSLQALGCMALEKWHRQEGMSQQVMPLYLKSHVMGKV